MAGTVRGVLQAHEHAPYFSISRHPRSWVVGQAHAMHTDREPTRPLTPSLPVVASKGHVHEPIQVPFGRLTDHRCDRKDLQSWIAKIYNTIEKNGRRFSRYVLEIPPNFQSGIDSHLFEIICVLVEISDFLRYIQRNASNLSEIIFDVLTYFYMGALRRFPRSLNMNLRISSIGIFESPPSDLASAP
jgi:hypothetical protein